MSWVIAAKHQRADSRRGHKLRAETIKKEAAQPPLHSTLKYFGALAGPLDLLYRRLRAAVLTSMTFDLVLDGIRVLI